MKIDVLIERIENGFIVISNDSEKRKVYYRSIVEFFELEVAEQVVEESRSIMEHEASTTPLRLVFNMSSIND